MAGNDDFTNWFPNVYLKKYPSPSRNNSYLWTNENLNQKNFNFVTEEKFKNSIAFNKKQLALYFTTQSNIISAVEKNETTYGQVENWLNKELAPFFENDDTTRQLIMETGLNLFNGQTNNFTAKRALYRISPKSNFNFKPKSKNETYTSYCCNLYND